MNEKWNEITCLHLPPKLVDRLSLRVVEEAVLAYELEIFVELLGIGVLIGGELLLHRAQIHGLLDEIVVAGDVQSLFVDGVQERPRDGLGHLRADQLLQNLLAVVHPLRELPVPTGR